MGTFQIFGRNPYFCCPNWCGSSAVAFHLDEEVVEKQGPDESSDIGIGV